MRTDRQHRRSFLAGGVAIATSLAGCGAPGPGGADVDETPAEADRPGGPQESGDVSLVRLVGRTDGWVGQGPESTSDEVNPTLRLRADREYEILWENRDGERHQLVIRNGDGQEVLSTEPASNLGETRSVRFTATEGLAEYYCPFHPQSMRGELQVDGDEPRNASQ